VCDIDWQDASLVVAGKGRRRDRLPLPQEVGDALLAYLERARPRCTHERVFVRARAPHRPFAGRRAVGTLAARAIRRAKVTAPSYGAHVLRHSLATRMLREGSSLEAIAGLLRHSSLQSTALYAKVDVVLLREIAQPWPEEGSC